MELSRRAVIGERALALLLIAAALAAAWAQAGATLTAREREGRPWLAWVEARARGAAVPPSLHLAIYDPVARRLAVLHVPGETKLDKKRTVERAYLEALKASEDPDAAARAAEDLAEERLRELSPEPIPAVSGRLTIQGEPPAEDEEPSVDAAFRLKERARSPRVWARVLRDAARGLRRGDRAAADPLLFNLELRRVRVEGLQPARLPDEPLAPGLLARLLSTEPRPADARQTTAEVLNATGASGLATRASKMLRLRGVDVLATGSSRPRARTLAYDRTGDFRRAEGVLAAIGCPSARAVTRLDPSRVVDVSVEVGADCAAAFGTGESREP